MSDENVLSPADARRRAVEVFGTFADFVKAIGPHCSPGTTELIAVVDPPVERVLTGCATGDHKWGWWVWTTCVTPGDRPYAARGWWTRCMRCRAAYKFDAGASERGRPWWKLFRFYRG